MLKDGNKVAKHLSSGGAFKFLRNDYSESSRVTISSPDLVSARLDAWTYGPCRAAFSYDGRGSGVKGYLPSVSTFFLSSSFIFLTVGLRLLFV